MYLIDTNVISESRKGTRCNPGVRRFFARVASEGIPVFLSAVTLGELRRGVELIRHRGDATQADQLEKWLQGLLRDHPDSILDLDVDVAQMWGRLRVPNHENALDKQIAATALIHDLEIVTRNSDDFAQTGARVSNPFTSARATSDP